MTYFFQEVQEIEKVEERVTIIWFDCDKRIGRSKLQASQSTTTLPTGVHSLAIAVWTLAETRTTRGDFLYTGEKD